MRFLLVAFAILLFLLLLWQAVPVLLLLFASALIAIALRFLSDGLTRLTGIPPLWSLTVVLLLVIVGSGLTIAFTAPVFWEQMKLLTESLQRSLYRIEEVLRASDAGKWLLEQIPRTDDLTDNASQIWRGIATFFGTTFGAITGFLITLIVSMFLAYDPRLYIAGFLRLIPKENRSRAGQIITELGYTLRWWMVGQLISMAALFVTTWIMLWILEVPLAFVLGLITGLLTFVPYLGPIIALVPILLIAFVESPTLALWVLALYLVIQNIEANVLMPIVFKKTVHMPPALTVLAQLLLGGMLGFIGIILATPLMAAAIVLVRMVYVEDVIGDNLEQPLKETPI